MLCYTYISLPLFYQLCIFQLYELCYVIDQSEKNHIPFIPICPGVTSRYFRSLVNKMQDQIPLRRELNDFLQTKILHRKSSANSFLFFSFQSNMEETVREGGRGTRIPRHEIHFACRFWRQLPFTKTICVLLNGGDVRGRRIARKGTKWVSK